MISFLYWGKTGVFKPWIPVLETGAHFRIISNLLVDSIGHVNVAAWNVLGSKLKCGIFVNPREDEVDKRLIDTFQEIGEDSSVWADPVVVSWNTYQFLKFWDALKFCHRKSHSINHLSGRNWRTRLAHDDFACHGV